MLRITIHEERHAITLHLEGTLAGQSLRVLEECWQGTIARRGKSILRVDLTDVTFVDDAGEACLAAMHRQGARFVAVDCMTKAIIAEITRSSLPGNSKITAT